MTATTHDANDILMGGGGPPSFKFAEPGAAVAGTIASPPQAFQEREYDPNNLGGGAPKVFPSGDPIMGITIDIKTNLRDPSIDEDDGVRRIYVQGKRLKETIRDAVRAGGGAKLEVGGHLAVTFTHREDPADKRSAKHYTAAYTSAASVQLMGGPAQVTTPQGQVNTTTGEIAQPPIAPPATPAGPTPEAVAALRAAGVDPASVYPGYTG